MNAFPLFFSGSRGNYVMLLNATLCCSRFRCKNRLAIIYNPVAITHEHDLIIDSAGLPPPEAREIEEKTCHVSVDKSL